MAKFYIMAALKSEIDSSVNGILQCESKVRLVFHSEMLEHATKRGNEVTFDCYGFSVDEEDSSSEWREVFNFNEQPPRGVNITINPSYKSGIVLPYGGGNLLGKEVLVLIIIGTIFN